jgi:hypothetical protein
MSSALIGEATTDPPIRNTTRMSKPFLRLIYTHHLG